MFCQQLWLTSSEVKLQRSCLGWFVFETRCLLFFRWDCWRFSMVFINYGLFSFILLWCRAGNQTSLIFILFFLVKVIKMFINHSSFSIESCMMIWHVCFETSVFQRKTNKKMRNLFFQVRSTKYTWMNNQSKLGFPEFWWHIIWMLIQL